MLCSWYNEVRVSLSLTTTVTSWYCVEMTGTRHLPNKCCVLTSCFKSAGLGTKQRFCCGCHCSFRFVHSGGFRAWYHRCPYQAHFPQRLVCRSIYRNSLDVQFVARQMTLGDISALHTTSRRLEDCHCRRLACNQDQAISCHEMQLRYT